MEILKPALQQTVDKWSCFKKHLKEISLYVIRFHSSLQQLRAPVFSLQQAERLLQHLQVTHGRKASVKYHPAFNHPNISNRDQLFKTNVANIFDLTLNIDRLNDAVCVFKCSVTLK